MTLIANTIIIVSIIPINIVFDKDSKGLFIYKLIMKKKIIFVKSFFLLFYLQFLIHRVNIG